MTIADAEGHVLGNFHAYYSFNPVDERLRFMDVTTSNAVRQALLALSDAAAQKAEESGDENGDDEENGDAGSSGSTTVIDIGCNEGDLTIELYEALNKGSRYGGSSTGGSVMSEDVAMFDANSTSVLNDMLQKEKKRVEFVMNDEGGTSHRKHFACEVHVGGECVGKGEGVSKKVAKAKAAEAAIQVLRRRQPAASGDEKDSSANSVGAPSTEAPATAAELAAGVEETEEEATNKQMQTVQFEKRKKLFVLGVDIDKVLIKRAAGKPVSLFDGDVVQFREADVSEPSFDDAIRSFLELAKRSPSQRQFDLVTCFSVTMWIHLNKGDDGLWKFLDRVCEMTNHLIIEPQPWKCYRNAQKRLSRMRVEIPASFREIQVRQDIVERIDAFLLDAGRFRFKAQLGKTNWSRPVVLYSRTQIPGLVYADRSVAELEQVTPSASIHRSLPQDGRAADARARRDLHERRGGRGRAHGRTLRDRAALLDRGDPAAAARPHDVHGLLAALHGRHALCDPVGRRARHRHLHGDHDHGGLVHAARLRPVRVHGGDERLAGRVGGLVGARLPVPRGRLHDSPAAADDPDLVLPAARARLDVHSRVDLFAPVGSLRGRRRHVPKGGPCLPLFTPALAALLERGVQDGATVEPVRPALLRPGAPAFGVSNAVFLLFSSLQRSFWVYVATALAGGVLFGLQLVRSLSLPKLRENAKKIMCRLLSSGGIQPSVDFVVRDDSFWLDWMSDGLVAIGESYVGGLWGINASKSLDEVIAALMTIPMEARQEMYRSWSARIVALAARLFNYAPSSVGLIVGAASEQFDLCPKFRRDYMDKYLHQGFGLWGEGVSNIEEAQARKLVSIDEKLQLEAGHCVLDLNIGSWGGVGCYLADKHDDITVVSVLSSIQEFVHAKKFARELGVFDQIEFILADTPEKLLTTLSGFRASNFDRIVCSGVVEALLDAQKLRFLRTIKRIQKSHAVMVLEFIACSAARTSTHGWNNKYVNSSFPCYPVTLNHFRMLVSECAFTIHEIAAYSQHYEHTFLDWHRRFQARWNEDDEAQQQQQRQLQLQGRRLGRLSSTGSSADSETRALDRNRTLPESFKRTWEFYLLHSAACFRAQALQVFQVQMS